MEKTVSIFSIIWIFFFGPKFKVGDTIIIRCREPWEENLPIKILEIGSYSYRVSAQYRIGKQISSFERTIDFDSEWFYKKEDK